MFLNELNKAGHYINLEALNPKATRQHRLSQGTLKNQIGIFVFYIETPLTNMSCACVNVSVCGSESDNQNFGNEIEHGESENQRKFYMT